MKGYSVPSPVSWLSHMLWLTKTNGALFLSCSSSASQTQGVEPNLSAQNHKDVFPAPVADLSYILNHKQQYQKGIMSLNLHWMGRKMIAALLRLGNGASFYLFIYSLFWGLWSWCMPMWYWIVLDDPHWKQWRLHNFHCGFNNYIIS